MAVSLETAQTLAIGPFNPHIIIPPWLVKNSICDDAEVEILLLPTPLFQGVSFRFQDIYWQIDFRTLMVASRTENCGELVARVIDKLHHTPVAAVGNNFHYAGALSQWDKSPLPMLGGKGWDAFTEMGSVDQLRWTGAFMQGGTRVEITLGQSENGVVVLFNFHRDMNGSEGAGAAARHFEQDKRVSQDLLGKLFQQEVEP